MNSDKSRKWIEHPEVAGKVIRALRRTDESVGGDSHIVLEFTDDTSLALGANDLGTWVETPANYRAQPQPTQPMRDVKGDYAMVKAMAEQLAQPEQLRLAHELLVLAQAPRNGTAQPKRYASDFYGIWKGVVFNEEDFKAAEWYLPRDDPE